jgi:hypothetical protein
MRPTFIPASFISLRVNVERRQGKGSTDGFPAESGGDGNGNGAKISIGGFSLGG